MSHSIIWQLPQDAEAFRQHFFSGGVFAYPTEAVYGIGANPCDEAATLAVIRLKQRDIRKGLIITAANWAQCQGFIGNISPAAQAEMDAINTERPTTFILPAGEKLAAAVTDSATGRIALRISKHPVICALCHIVTQPIISTSGNLAGQAPALSQRQIQRYFPELPCIAGELGDANAPSRIMDWQTQQYLRM